MHELGVFAVWLFGFITGSMGIIIYILFFEKKPPRTHVNPTHRDIPHQSKPRIISRSEAMEADLEEKRLAAKGWDAESVT